MITVTNLNFQFSIFDLKKTERFNISFPHFYPKHFIVDSLNIKLVYSFGLYYSIFQKSFIFFSLS